MKVCGPGHGGGYYFDENEFLERWTPWGKPYDFSEIIEMKYLRFASNPFLVFPESASSDTTSVRRLRGHLIPPSSQLHSVAAWTPRCASSKEKRPASHELPQHGRCPRQRLTHGHTRQGRPPPLRLQPHVQPLALAGAGARPA